MILACDYKMHCEKSLNVHLNNCLWMAPQAKVVNPTTGQMVPLGSLGEVMIRGFCVMLEYWDDEAKTAECITKEGWYKTGWVTLSLYRFMYSSSDQCHFYYAHFSNDFLTCLNNIDVCGLCLLLRDIGSLDAYSYLRIEGRIKDMIIRGGENIYPAEIEQFLHTHPKVKEAQVSTRKYVTALHDMPVYLLSYICLCWIMC